MKRALTISLGVAALAATLSFVVTGLKSESPVVSEAKATESELEPATIVLAQNTVSVFNYDRGPRIIIVPQTGDRTDRNRASVASDVDDDDIAPRRGVAPPVRATPRWVPRSETPRVETTPRRVEIPMKSRTETRSESRQEKRVVRHIDMSKPKPKAEVKVAIPQPPIPQPPGPRRSVLSAPPPPAEGPSPIKPTPKFDSNLDSKLGARAESAAPAIEQSPDAALGETPPPAEITADQPPPGYTPPASAARDDKY